jgi:S-methylmethionine-dependent homocysteine/selenocysteine methylase
MQPRPIVLDGGTGRELLRLGAPFRQPEWSALALIEGPEYVARVHQRYIDAGADVITTNSYAVVPFHIGEARFRQEGFALAALSGKLARGAADESNRAVLVAGSLPPVCGSYRPDLFDAGLARPVLQELVRALSPYVDLWLAETVSSEAEMVLMSEVLAGTPQPWWVSYTLSDDPAHIDFPRLRSGEAVEACVVHAARLGVQAVLFNCCQPEAIGAAVGIARRALDALAASDNGPHVRVGAYANAFPPQPATASANAELSALRADLGPQEYLIWVKRWLADGAEVVGGCCGVGPEHIALIRASVG